jgi:hypothetical protein
VPVSFRPNVQVNADPGNLKDDFGPAVAVDKSGTIYVVWNVEEPGDTGIYFARSTDRGATFSAAVRVNDNVTYPPSYDAFQPDIAVDGAGHIYVVWHDYRAWADDYAYTSPIDVYLDKSTDGGASFDPKVKVDDTGDATEQGFSSIAVDPVSGDVYAAFL